MRNIQILSSLKFYALSDQIVYFFESDFGGERGLFVPGSYRHGTGLPVPTWDSQAGVGV